MRSREAKKACYYQTRGCWVASYTGPDGKRKVKRLPLAGNAEEAAEEFLSLQDAKTTEEPSTESGSSLKPILETFERQVMTEMRPATVAIYRQVFGLLGEAGIKAIADVRPGKLSALRDVFLRHKMGAATQYKLLRATKRSLRWSKEPGFTNNVPDFDMPRLRKKSKGRFLVEAEIQIMLGVVDLVYHHHPYRAVGCKRLLWLEGLRLSECLTLLVGRPGENAARKNIFPSTFDLALFLLFSFAMQSRPNYKS